MPTGNDEPRYNINNFSYEPRSNIYTKYNYGLDKRKNHFTYNDTIVNIPRYILISEFTNFDITHHITNNKFTDPSYLTIEKLHRYYIDTGQTQPNIKKKLALNDDLIFYFRYELNPIFKNFKKSFYIENNLLQNIIPEDYDLNYKTYVPILEAKNSNNFYKNIPLNTYPLYANIDFQNRSLVFNQKDLEKTNILKYIDNLPLYLSFIRYEGNFGAQISDSIPTSISGSFEHVNDVSQTFYEIMTQQPYKFNKLNNETVITSDTINLNWNYDNIIAKLHNNSTAILALFDSSAQRQLPYINSISIEISGTVNGTPTGYIDLSTITIPDYVSYNQDDNYKTYTIKKYTQPNPPGSADYSQNVIRSLTNSFDIRIYGNNYANQIPYKETRSLTFSNLSFTIANPPSTPNFISQARSGNIITLTHEVSYIEKDTNDAVLNNYIIDYSQNDTRSIYSIDPIVLSQTGIVNTTTSNPNKFSIDLSNLKYGTKYSYSLAVANNLNDNSYSQYTTLRDTSYTDLPTSNGISAELDLSINNLLYKYVSSPHFDNSYVIYINLSGDEHISFFNKTNYTIQITNPDNSITDMSGYGKYIDNSLNLVLLNVSVNDMSKQKIIFDGSFATNYDPSNIILGANDFSFITSVSSEDMYPTDISRRGFRLQGTININNIINSDITNAIGDASSNPYKLNYNYIRQPDVNSSYSNDISYEIYIDKLTSNPVIDGSNTVIVTDVCYNFGIPSVAKFDLSFNRDYKNINSEFGYIKGDKIISTIYYINKTSATANKSITINNINTNGNYTYPNNSENLGFPESYYKDLHYKDSILDTDFSLSWSENVINLKDNSHHIFSINTNHYVDYASFNHPSGLITSPKINLSHISIFEISNISLIDTEINSTLINDLIPYNDHTKSLKRDYTLLYINDSFQSNITKLYPNINEFSYNNINIPASNLYNNRDASFNDYKWIAFKLIKNDNNGSYSFNNINYHIKNNTDLPPYLDLGEILTNILSRDNINNLFSSDSSSVIGFVASQTQTQSGATFRFGNIKVPFVPAGGNWINNGASPNSNGEIRLDYKELTKNSNRETIYGCKVEEKVSSTQGIYINFNNLLNELTLVIGIKNK